MQSNLFIFAGGGTGGHLYPGLAVAAELLKLRPKAKIVFACSNRAIDRRILDPQPYAIVPQPVKPIPGGLTGWVDFARAFIASATQAKAMIADLKPEAVLGLGGFAAGPVVRAAAKANVPSALLNPDAVPGKANKMLCRYVQAIFTQFDRTITCLPASVRQKVSPLGCPIRTSLLSAPRQQAITALGLKPGLSTLLILGGSLGAASINEAIVKLLPDLAPLADTWQLLHITGPDKSGDLSAALAKAPLQAVSMEYCQQMELAYAAADLVLCRSGASTVAELSALHLPSVLLPYPYHRDHQQRLNAAGLASAGSAIICEDAKNPTDNAQRLRQSLLTLMKDAVGLEKMRQSAAAIGKPNAAMDIAQWLADGNNRSMA
jgi:UDP-N-acetylglucosamine--N-acetylmuramyl-(pentapeptide) pyrophosphoryl-undecaprenol N-acetylglucosamine transferase